MFGGYMCKASNKLGYLNQIITLKKGFKPPKPSHIKAKSVTSDTITLEIVGIDFNNVTQIPLKMLPFGYRIQYRPKDESIKWTDAAFQDYKLTEGKFLCSFIICKYSFLVQMC